ncbi:hypothetical protein PR048_033101 [Dryococelus australis]|uniref:Uncharacterized protein n=1 Tax=Dryococelus australis TaxID=614101 RepID=A0ABQ9FZA3_9NEOP|nr:hypothetical protein PR048_033101 [Dryococelus australis]
MGTEPEFHRPVIETRYEEEPPGTKVECYSEENYGVKSDRIPSDSDKAETYLSTRCLVCKLCNLVSTDCKCQQHCEALYLSAEHEDVTGELPNSPSPQCNDKQFCYAYNRITKQNTNFCTGLQMALEKQNLPTLLVERSL